MSTQTKTPSQKTEQLSKVASNLGISLMALATTLGIFEVSDHLKTTVTTPNRPVFAYAENNEAINSVKRSSEEVAPHYISYSESQRTPSRSGKR